MTDQTCLLCGFNAADHAPNEEWGEHQQRLHELYPQGWDTYPGDICEHGKHTGGSGADRICLDCE